MNRENSYKVIVAEQSPILRVGVAGCLRSIQSPTLQVMEVHTPEELESQISSSPDIVVTSPVFSSITSSALRELCGQNIKLVAIETIPLNESSRQYFDATISITDSLETIDKKINQLCQTDEESNTPSDEKESLSQREKEIVELVVKGMTNKQIADKLYLSVHTVVTHRRNIARKLEIHSATGLTIYAIVNKIVDISDVNL